MELSSVVLVPGAWHSRDVYNSVSQSLSHHGYPTISLDLPSATNSRSCSFSEDVEHIRACVTELVVSRYKDVVVVGHSYSGLPMSEALQGLGKEERQQKGQYGGVIRLVFVSALVPPEGFMVKSGDAQFPAWMKVDEQQGVVTVTAEDAKQVFYHDLFSDEAETWAMRLLPQNLGVYLATTTYAAWRHIPSTYIMCTDDRTAITVQVAEMMIEGARKLQSDAFDVVERFDSGHCIMLSHPDWLVQSIRRSSGEIKSI